MKLYADAPARRTRQLLLDALVGLWIALCVQLGRVVAHTVDRLAAPGRTLENAGGDLAGSLGDAAGAAGRLPVVGGPLAAPLRAAGSAASEVARAGAATESAVTRVALVLGLVVALLPIALMLLRWLPERVGWVRTATAAAACQDSLDEDLLALRALSRRPLWELQRVSPRPGAACAAGDRAVRARLAELELDALGLRPKAAATEPGR